LSLYCEAASGTKTLRQSSWESHTRRCLINCTPMDSI